MNDVNNEECSLLRCNLLGLASLSSPVMPQGFLAPRTCGEKLDSALCRDSECSLGSFPLYRREVAPATVAFHLVSESSGGSLYPPRLNSFTRYAVPTQEAGNALVTYLRLRLSMRGDDQLFSDELPGAPERGRLIAREICSKSMQKKKVALSDDFGFVATRDEKSFILE
ncbi:hypothetical protein EVAR_97563_1 [Eumeta japonica]|uniref:Uncharacterized protein n=1 Tax=Eumeta variegata TaxID=151549 RepID=A0A4C1WQ37_EUMVA|nr:hypothetical protein EVAR_97563_1 [Eumeta japonica]